MLRLAPSNRRRAVALGAALGAAVVAAACARSPRAADQPGEGAGAATPPASRGAAARGDSLTDRRWRLVALDARPAVETPGGEAPYILLRSDTARVEGDSGCNALFGRYERTGSDGLRFVELGGTLRACADPAPADQERRFTTALLATRRFAIRGDTLTLFDDAAIRARLVAPPR